MTTTEDNKIKEALKEESVRSMKKPTILINNLDFDEFIQANGYEYALFKDVNGIPVITRMFIERGKFIIFDKDKL